MGNHRMSIGCSANKEAIYKDGIRATFIEIQSSNLDERAVLELAPFRGARFRGGINNGSIRPFQKLSFGGLFTDKEQKIPGMDYSKIKDDGAVCNKRGWNFNLALPDYNLLKRHLRPREIEKESKAIANLPKSTKRGRRAVVVLPFIS
ncbi:hypothetical protein [Alloprevotella tannerae]|nr:hypothetical protein [Alloprevotella tannerae]